MGKKLTAKVQKLSFIPKEKSLSFSVCVTVEPEERKQILEKGTVYAVFDLSSDVNLDVGVVTKLINDVLHNAYYSSESVSPIQSLEKALIEVRDRLVKFPGDETALRDVKIEFNVIAAVLWGNVLYVVQNGKGQSYLMRDGEIRPIQSMSEGNFSAASGVVKDDDVVVLCTEEFGNAYPPKKLLTLSISEKTLKNRESCILLKFIVDTSFNENEVVNLNPVPATSKQKVEVMVESLAKKIQNANPIIKKAGEVLPAPNSSYTPTTVLATPLEAEPENVSSGSKALFLIPAILFVVGFGVFLTLKFVIYPSKTSEAPKDETPIVSTVPVPAEEANDDTSKDAEEKITRVGVANVLFDLKIADELINPTDLVLYKNKLVVTDSSRGKVYTSLIGDYKFLPLEESYFGVRSPVVNEDGKMTFLDNTGYKVYDLVKLELSESYKNTVTTPLNTFAGFIYTFDGDKLIKYTKASGALTASTWGQNADFLNAKDLSIAYSIFVLTGDDRLVSYTTGNKTSFAVTGLATPLKDAVGIYTSTDFDNIYVADKGNNRLVVLDKKGVFVKQFKFTKSSEWADIKGLAVSADEKTLYLLSGSKIYEVVLK